MSEHGSITAKQAGQPNIFGMDDSPAHFPHGPRSSTLHDLFYHAEGQTFIDLSGDNLGQSILHWFLADLFTLGGASVDWQLSPTPTPQTTAPSAICVAHSFRRNATMLTHCDVNLVLQYDYCYGM